jgi:hypothetical protein
MEHHSSPQLEIGVRLVLILAGCTSELSNTVFLWAFSSHGLPTFLVTNLQRIEVREAMTMGRQGVHTRSSFAFLGDLAFLPRTCITCSLSAA